MYAYSIETIRELSLEKFLDDIARERLRLFMNEVEEAKEWGDARALIDIFEAKYPQLLDPLRTPPLIVQELRELWARAVFMSFPNVKDAAVERLYREHVLAVFLHHQDPRLILDDQLSLYGYAGVLSARLSVIARALEQNTERLGVQDIVREDGRTLPPQIQGWLREYRFNSSRAVERGAVEQATFLSKNKNVGYLDASGKQMLAKILQFVDYLYFPTFHVVRESGLAKRLEWAAKKVGTTLADIASEIQRTVIASRSGKGRPIPPPTTRPSPIPLTPTLSLQGDGASSRISREEYWRQYLISHPKERLSMIKGLGTTTPMEATDVVPFIRALVLVGELQELLPPEHWTRHSLAARLKALYEETAGLSESDSAREAVHVANLLKQQGRPEFMDMAYYDMQEKRFLFGN